MPAGYSGTPLWKKLGIKPSSRIMLMHAPENYEELLGLDIQNQLVQHHEVPNLIHFFAKDLAQFGEGMKILKPLYLENTFLVIWVSWYKKSSGIKTDITEDTIRDYALLNGLVDVKVCAISDYWSGLKLVVPLANR